MAVLAHGNRGTMNNRDKYLGECVIFAREQVRSSRIPSWDTRQGEDANAWTPQSWPFHPDHMECQ